RKRQLDLITTPRHGDDASPLITHNVGDPRYLSNLVARGTQTSNVDPHDDIRQLAIGRHAQFDRRLERTEVAARSRKASRGKALPADQVGNCSTHITEGLGQ